MADAIYPVTKKTMLDHILGLGTLKAALVDTDLVAYSAAHDFYADISAAVVGTPVEITTPTTTGGLLNGDDVTFVSVPAGDPLDAVVIYVDTGVAGTSPLLAFLNTGVTGLPVVPTGANIPLAWDAAGIVQL